MLIRLRASWLSPCYLLPSFFLTPSAVSIPLRSNHFYEHCEPFISAFEDLVFGKNKQMWFDVTHAVSTSTCSNLGLLKSRVSKLGRLCWPSLFCADLIFLMFIMIYIPKTNTKLIHRFAAPASCLGSAHLDWMCSCWGVSWQQQKLPTEDAQGRFCSCLYSRQTVSKLCQFKWSPRSPNYLKRREESWEKSLAGRPHFQISMKIPVQKVTQVNLLR